MAGLGEGHTVRSPCQPTQPEADPRVLSQALQHGFVLEGSPDSRAGHIEDGVFMESGDRGGKPVYGRVLGSARGKYGLDDALFWNERAKLWQFTSTYGKVTAAQPITYPGDVLQHAVICMQIPAEEGGGFPLGRQTWTYLTKDGAGIKRQGRAVTVRPVTPDELTAFEQAQKVWALPAFARRRSAFD